jgi:hypothetical protein
MKISHLHKNLLLALIVFTTFSLSAHNGVLVSPKMYLKGALQPNGLMRDDLRSKGLLPSTEPYSALAGFQHYGDGGGEAISNPAVFHVIGNNAIVDWVVVELRSENAATVPLVTHAALLQRDGDVVDMDGISPLHFLVANGEYYVVVRHRNHLGVMTAVPKSLSNQPLLVDFTDPNMPLYGTNPCFNDGTVRALWLGDTNRDKKVIFQGAGNDVDLIFFQVLLAPGNINASINYILTDYSQLDNNLDGMVAYSGPNNDKGIVWEQIFANCVNGCSFVEQIP